ncbi:hypothetical protein like AT1G11340 [Hibiscus trionum]|uniref:Non-specific serine/threonine protein kinase n=1 Tax=Hibiscus trionum TaxID=183268 RepID=A0A9W7MQZ9_HIBTR|nr:hypothetical protein like AT1G11340 [Hibiscus trionum]
MLSFMKLGLSVRTGLNRVYTSWKSPDDPGFRNYSLRINPDLFPQMFVYKGSAPWWRSGPWTGQRWSGIPEMATNVIFNVSFVNTEDEVSFSFNVKDGFIASRTVMNETGIVQGLGWNNESQRWIVSYSIPKEQCDFYGHSGPNSYCNPDIPDGFECTCFPGFEPKSPEAWLIKDGSGGCVRKRGISMCGNGEGFVKVSHAKVPDTLAALVDMSTIGLKQCQEMCLRNCSCMAYASAYSEIDKGTGCLTWHGDLVDARTFTNTGQDLYIRVDANELARYTKKGLLRKKGVLAVIIVSSAVVFLLLVALLCCILRRRRRARTRRSKNISSFTTFEESLGGKDIDEGRRNGDLSFFDLSTVAAATNNFSSDNKLGQGGFGPVYKGVLLNGKEIAVKRLSKHSGQGVEEFKNEIVLIAKLQHRNLVRMLGCCIEGEEKMLVYEFLPNKSLDSIVFDESKRSVLDWKKRLEIICGIARGMLYLHQDSRIFGGDQIEGDTKRVVGTYGYMSPEYAMHGHFSTKLDVYSFGILMLEIITGKSNNRYVPDSPSLNLVGHIWELWKEGKATQAVDSALGDSYPADEILKCIQIGLMCVQEHATDRPMMSAVVSMLSNETTLQLPKPPAFFVKKNEISSGEGTVSANGVTISMIQPR